MIMTIAAMTSNSASGSILYHSSTLLVLNGVIDANSTWAAVDQGEQQGYKIDGMSAYTYQTGDTELGFTLYREVIITMSK